MTRLLLIEDEPILRDNTQELLEAYGYECITAEDGREGLDKAINNNPDLIICDIMLPYLTGYEVKTELNKDEITANIPFIYLSAKIGHDDQSKGMDLGAADYITKPFKIAELVKSVELHLSQNDSFRTKVSDMVAGPPADFIHRARHECNTPLHAIIALSDLLYTQNTRTDSFLNEVTLAINKSGKRLFKTLNNLIDLLRLKHYAGLEDYNGTNIDLKDALQQRLKEISLTYQHRVMVKADIASLRSVMFLSEDIDILFAELLDNAFKFSPKDTEVNVRLYKQPDDGQNQFNLVVDNAIARPMFFNVADIAPFKQYDGVDDDLHGSGLGLYLLKLITEKYNGTLHIQQPATERFSVKISLPY